MPKKFFFLVALIFPIIGAGGFFVLKHNAPFLKAQISEASKILPPDPATLAQCLSVKGVKIYGVSPCAQCEAQKRLFGEAWKDVDYIDCSDEQGTRIPKPQCRSIHLSAFPTWVFPNNLRLEGETNLQKLADASGCRGS